MSHDPYYTAIDLLLQGDAPDNYAAFADDSTSVAKRLYELLHRMLYLEGMIDCRDGIAPRKRHPTYTRAYSEEYARGEKPISTEDKPQ